MPSLPEMERFFTEMPETFPVRTACASIPDCKRTGLSLVKTLKHQSGNKAFKGYWRTLVEVYGIALTSISPIS
jgi:hypothetical protein